MNLGEVTSTYGHACPSGAAVVTVRKAKLNSLFYPEFSLRLINLDPSSVVALVDHTVAD